MRFYVVVVDNLAYCLGSMPSHPSVNGGKHREDCVYHPRAFLMLMASSRNRDTLAFRGYSKSDRKTVRASKGREMSARFSREIVRVYQRHRGFAGECRQH